MLSSRLYHYALRVSALICLGLLPACDKPAKKSGTQPPSAESDFLAKYSGNLDAADSERVELWAWDELQPDSPLKVEIYDGETLLATVKADAFRKDLKENGIGDGRHGFSYEMPESIRDGKTHVISAKISGTDFTIGSPKTVVHTQKGNPK